MERRDYQRSRLDFLDGLRALLALKVVLLHAGYFFFLPDYVQWIGQRTFAVASFITISGFVLYLPSASEETVRMKRSFGDYIKRRAIRLLPAWYAGLILTCLLFNAMVWLGMPNGLSFEQTWQSLLWHASFLFSWNGEHRYSLNSALWFMGYELQLSLCFPLFLVLVRRFGWWPLLAFGIALTLPLPGQAGLLRTVFSPVLTFPFIIGILAARIARRPDLFFRGLGERKIAFVLLAAFAVTFLLYLWSDEIKRGVLISCFASLTCASALIHMTYFKESWCQRLLSLPLLRFIGGFSYSIFLTHEPLLRFLSSATSGFDLSPTSRFYLIFLPCLGLVMVVAYLFYLVFERPAIRWNERLKRLPTAP